MRRHTQWKQQSSPGGSQGRERFLAPGTPCLTRPEPPARPPGAGLVPPERGWSPWSGAGPPGSGARAPGAERAGAAAGSPSAPRRLPHPGRRPGDTAPESNYTPQLTYESSGPGAGGRGEGGARGAAPAAAPGARDAGTCRRAHELSDWLPARAGPRPPLAARTRDRREEGAGSGAGGAAPARAAF